jgi:hypothetical protein
MRVWTGELIAGAHQARELIETKMLIDRGVVRAAMVRADGLQLVVRADRLQLAYHSNRLFWEPEIVSDNDFHHTRILFFVLVHVSLHFLKLLCDVCLHFLKMLCVHM